MMAAGDYRSCDVCGGKAFYDANLNYETGDKINGEWVYPEAPYRVAGEDQGQHAPALDHVGDWAVICTDCAKTHRTAILPLTAAPQPTQAERVPMTEAEATKILHANGYLYGPSSMAIIRFTEAHHGIGAKP